MGNTEPLEQRLKRIVEEAGGRFPDTRNVPDITAWMGLGAIAVFVVAWLIITIIGG